MMWGSPECQVDRFFVVVKPGAGVAGVPCRCRGSSGTSGAHLAGRSGPGREAEPCRTRRPRAGQDKPTRGDAEIGYCGPLAHSERAPEFD